MIMNELRSTLSSSSPPFPLHLIGQRMTKCRNHHMVMAIEMHAFHVQFFCSLLALAILPQHFGTLRRFPRHDFGNVFIHNDVVSSCEGGVAVVANSLKVIDQVRRKLTQIHNNSGNEDYDDGGEVL